MAARRCSTCSIDYPESARSSEDLCFVCGGNLNFFSNTEPNEDWEGDVQRLLWTPNEYVGPMYAGATVMTRFERFLDSLVGVDDFILECGDWAPKGHD